MARRQSAVGNEPKGGGMANKKATRKTGRQLRSSDISLPDTDAIGADHQTPSTSAAPPIVNGDADKPPRRTDTDVASTSSPTSTNGGRTSPTAANVGADVRSTGVEESDDHGNDERGVSETRAFVFATSPTAINSAAPVGNGQPLPVAPSPNSIGPNAKRARLSVSLSSIGGASTLNSAATNTNPSIASPSTPPVSSMNQLTSGVSASSSSMAAVPNVQTSTSGGVTKPVLMTATGAKSSSSTTMNQRSMMLVAKTPSSTANGMPSSSLSANHNVKRVVAGAILDPPPNAASIPDGQRQTVTIQANRAAQMMGRPMTSGASIVHGRRKTPVLSKVSSMTTASDWSDTKSSTSALPPANVLSDVTKSGLRTITASSALTSLLQGAQASSSSTTMHTSPTSLSNDDGDTHTPTTISASTSLHASPRAGSPSGNAPVFHTFGGVKEECSLPAHEASIDPDSAPSTSYATSHSHHPQMVVAQRHPAHIRVLAPRPSISTLQADFTALASSIAQSLDRTGRDEHVDAVDSAVYMLEAIVDVERRMLQLHDRNPAELKAQVAKTAAEVPKIDDQQASTSKQSTAGDAVKKPSAPGTSRQNQFHQWERTVDTSLLVDIKDDFSAIFASEVMRNKTSTEIAKLLVRSKKSLVDAERATHMLPAAVADETFSRHTRFMHGQLQHGVRASRRGVIAHATQLVHARHTLEVGGAHVERVLDAVDSDATEASDDEATSAEAMGRAAAAMHVYGRSMEAKASTAFDPSDAATQQRTSTRRARMTVARELRNNPQLFCELRELRNTHLSERARISTRFGWINNRRDAIAWKLNFFTGALRHAHRNKASEPLVELVGTSVTSGAARLPTIGHASTHVFHMSSDTFDAATNRLFVDGDPSRIVNLADAGCARTSYIASNAVRPLTNSRGMHAWSTTVATMRATTHCQCTRLGTQPATSAIMQRVHARLGTPVNVQSDGVTPVPMQRRSHLVNTQSCVHCSGRRQHNTTMATTISTSARERAALIDAAIHPALSQTCVPPLRNHDRHLRDAFAHVRQVLPLLVDGGRRRRRVPVKRARQSTAATKTKASSPKRARLNAAESKIDPAMRAKSMRAIGYDSVDMDLIDHAARAHINKMCSNFEYNEKRKLARRAGEGTRNDRDYKAEKRRAKKTQHGSSSPTKHHVGKYSQADRIRQKALLQQRRFGGMRPSVQLPWLANNMQDMVAVNGVMIDQTVLSAARVEKLAYKEIEIPKWRDARRRRAEEEAKDNVAEHRKSSEAADMEDDDAVYGRLHADGEAAERKRFADVGKRSTVYKGRRATNPSITVDSSKDSSSSANATPDRQLVQPLRIHIQDEGATTTATAVCKAPPVRARANSTQSLSSSKLSSATSVVSHRSFKPYAPRTFPARSGV